MRLVTDAGPFVHFSSCHCECQPSLFRVCPGRHLVDSTMWILVVSVLAAFSVRKKVDLYGKEIPVDGMYKGALISWV